MNARRFAENVRNRDETKSMLRELVDRSVEHRCSECGHKLGIGTLGAGTLFETKCPRCSMIVTLAVPKSGD